MNWRAFIIACFVTGLISIILISILTGDNYKQECSHENGIVLKPLPLTIERKVGAVAQVYYKSYCVDCNEYFPHLSSEPNKPYMVVGTNYTDVSFVVSDERTGEDDYAGEWELSDADHYYPLRFSYQHEDGNRELDFELIDGEVVCNKSPEEAIEIIFLCLHRYYDRFAECTVPIRFPEPEEPNEPEIEIITPDANAFITMDMLSWAKPSTELIVNDTIIYLENMPLLDKDELRDFALALASMTAMPNSYWCDEFYDSLVRLVPNKLLQDPNEPEELCEPICCEENP